jgi:uncharacterized repeat protein (TIGR01451 family)
MKKFNLNLSSSERCGAIIAAIVIFGLVGSMTAFAATSPSLGTASTFGILSSTFTPSIASTAITGDLGYTTLSTGLYFTVSGNTHTSISDSPAGSVYQQAGTDQLAALNTGPNNLNNQPCTDISSLTPASLNGVIILGGSPGVFPPGCYFSSGAMGIDASTNIHLAGTGTYIFKSTGAGLTTGANSQVILDPGASACDVFWAPVGGTSLGATSIFKGTVIDAAGISVGDTVNWVGRALAFNGTVDTNHDIISVPSCVTPATLHVVKHVNGGSKTAANFTMTVTGTNVSSSSFPGSEASTTITLDPGVYNVDEATDTSYTKTIGAGCSGTATSGQNLTCTITNDYIVPAPTPATLHVIKFVIGGALGPSDFMVHVKNASGTDVSNSPLAGAATPGTLYSLPAGNYTVSENANTSYTRTFDGFCPGGNVALSAGQDLTCTIINTNIPLLAAVVPSVGSGGGAIVPLIGILKVPAPLALPDGAGSTTYNYTVWNVGGQQALDNISVADDKCGPVIYVSGDVNSNGKLDPNEKWKYSCTTTLLVTTVNTAVATGYSDDTLHHAAIATAVATVVVGSSVTPPLINIVKVPSRLTPFPFGGGAVTYTYTVTNPGVIAMNNVITTDNKCAPVSYVSGDVNGNNLLDPGESWTYTCQTNVPVSTMNTATAKGSANGFTAIGYAFATVLVSVPGLPNTGFPPAGNNMLWDIAMLVGGMVLISISLFVIFGKRRV